MDLGCRILGGFIDVTLCRTPHLKYAPWPSMLPFVFLSPIGATTVLCLATAQAEASFF